MLGTGSYPAMGTITITTYHGSAPCPSPFQLPAPTYFALLVPLLWGGQKEATQLSGKDCEPSEKGSAV